MRVLKFAVASAVVLATVACGSDGGVTAPDTRVSYTLGFEDDYLNLDTEAVVTCNDPRFQFCEQGLDLKLAYHAGRTVHAVVFQNQGAGAQIAHLRNKTFDAVTQADVGGAQFTASLIDEPFDATRVILIRTDLGKVYKLGNATENNQAFTVTFDADLLSSP